MRDTEPIEPMWEGPSDPGLGQRIAAAGVALGAGILKRTSPHVFSWAAGQSPGFAFAWGAHEYSLGRQGIRRRRRSGAGWEDNPRSNYSEAVSKRQERKSRKESEAERAKLEEALKRGSELEESLAARTLAEAEARGQLESTWESLGAAEGARDKALSDAKAARSEQRKAAKKLEKLEKKYAGALKASKEAGAERRAAETAARKAQRAADKARESNSRIKAELKDARSEARKAQSEARKQAGAPAPEPPASLDLSEGALEAAVDKMMGREAGSSDPGEVSRDPEVLRSQLESLRQVLQTLDDVGDFDLVESVDEELYQLHKAVEYKLKNHKASEAKSKLDGLFK